mmetsp:Transcript_19006/g.36928  ORF Transcript_19006/g.36928 Transcript_19006/m.36928 type:complete len:96 (-) Transcript_19006:1181-1468(-)
MGLLTRKRKRSIAVHYLVLPSSNYGEGTHCCDLRFQILSTSSLEITSCIGFSSSHFSYAFVRRTVIMIRARRKVPTGALDCPCEEIIEASDAPTA